MLKSSQKTYNYNNLHIRTTQVCTRGMLKIDTYDTVKYDYIIIIHTYKTKTKQENTYMYKISLPDWDWSIGFWVSCVIDSTFHRGTKITNSNNYTQNCPHPNIDSIYIPERKAAAKPRPPILFMHIFM